ncbi:COP9 signalosome complex subunit 12 [Kwoniella heveanensis BCC8398]|uniref:Protein CSN12 homolog n=1 Tax=Kwoniella heveanensis BCC8398 TaxID=1296120 RepID=A0A1B9GNN2_9TREE|nr:COP9 signalosome complex subunit 12 [Kwoniella heveanensis BCC8398]
MKLQQYVNSFLDPLRSEDAKSLTRLLSCHGKTARGLADTVGAIDDRRLANSGHSLPEPWDGIAIRHCAVVYSLYKTHDFQQAYTHQNALLSLFYRWFQDQSSWVLPVLYMLLQDLRDLAEQADQANYASTGKMPSIEECTRTVSKAFSMCATDRTFKGSESRRNGVYHVACLSLKCYFKVGKPNLCKNIIRAVTSDPKTPPIDEAPLPDQVTWHFYLGMLAFLNGEDKKAGEELSWALLHCPADAKRNQELILTYLIPLHLSHGSLPSPTLLSLHPRLNELFSPFIIAIKSGDVREYDERLDWAQMRLVGMSTYLVVERAREGCLRMLFKKAWIASDKSSRIPISTFQLALELHGVKVDSDEVECMVANMIYRGFIKGYISHEKQMVVLAKTNPFPNLSSIVR